MPKRQMRIVAMVMLLVALTLLAAAAGVFVRDIGARVRTAQTGDLLQDSTSTSRFYAYELTYELAVFTNVRVSTVVEALFYNWSAEFESNGSLVTGFRPALPGMLQVRVTNLEPVNGTLSLTVLQQSDLPPDLETALLNPLLYATIALLAASAVVFALAGERYGRG